MKLANKVKEEGFIANIKSFFLKFLQISIFLFIIIAVFYLAILTSIFIFGLVIAFGIISFLIIKFRKKDQFEIKDLD